MQTQYQDANKSGANKYVDDHDRIAHNAPIEPGIDPVNPPLPDDDPDSDSEIDPREIYEVAF